MRKVLFVLVVVLLVSAVLSACQPADVASYNLSVDADNFRIMRRIIFYNGITGDYIQVIEGRCSLGDADPAGELSVTCKVGDDLYVKHFLGLSDNVTYFVEQLSPKEVSTYHYTVIFRPQTVLPAFELDLE